MDYIVTDCVASPLELADQFTEKLAYMPDTFFVGDHRQMFAHMTERAVLDHRQGRLAEKKAENISIINGTNLKPLFEKGDLKDLDVVPHKDKLEIVRTPVLEVAATAVVSIGQMVSSGQSHTSVGGVVIQNGIINQTTNTKAASGEVVPDTPIITNRMQYGLPEDAVIYCNFNQLYKVDPEIFAVWCNVRFVVSLPDASLAYILRRF